MSLDLLTKTNWLDKEFDEIDKYKNDPSLFGS
jgi:hypothetical protein